MVLRGGEGKVVGKGLGRGREGKWKSREGPAADTQVVLEILYSSMDKKFLLVENSNTSILDCQDVKIYNN